MSLEAVVNVPNVMVECVRSLWCERIQDQINMNCGWFMGYYAVRAVVGYGIETAMVHPISTK